MYYCAYQVLISEALISDDNSFELILNGENSNAEIPSEVNEDQEFNLQSLIKTVKHDDILEI